MNGFHGIEVRRIEMSIPRCKKEWIDFLDKRGLEAVSNPEYAAGLYDADNRLVGCGVVDESVMKCVAVDESLEGEGLMSTLVTHLRQYAFANGCRNLMVFTKPIYRNTFESLAFKTIGVAPDAILLESERNGIERYKKYLQGLAKPGKNGVIVMNANPFTLGHRYLIEQASAVVDNLYVIPVADNPHTQFSYKDRVDMMRAGTADLANVVICEGSRYAVSASTFPSYFLKKRELITDTYIALDLDIFARHLAPMLNATKRFVGSEPSDMLTARYNELMHKLLPNFNMEIIEIERIKKDERIISASEVRRMLDNGSYGSALTMIPQVNKPRFLSYLAASALRDELNLTPKPGLVDKHDNGAHTDMDYDMMNRSIDVLQSVFYELATMPQENGLPSHSDLLKIGLAGEEKMLECTGGVNTHRGALFSLGLTVVATASILADDEKPTVENLPMKIKELASRFQRIGSSHGMEVRQKYGIPGALDYALGGYEKLFSSWLPYLRANEDDENKLYKLLLLIMSELDDTNVYYRAGKTGAKFVKDSAREILSSFYICKLSQLNEEYCRGNISPGGAADMLALTIFIDSITK